MNSLPNIWADTLRRIQTELPDFEFEAWIRPLAVKRGRDRLFLGCPSSFHRDRVRRNHLECLERCWREAFDAAPGDTADICPSVELASLAEFSDAAGVEIEVSVPARVDERQSCTTAVQKAGLRKVSATIARRAVGDNRTRPDSFAASNGMSESHTHATPEHDRFVAGSDPRPNLRSVPKRGAETATKSGQVRDETRASATNVGHALGFGLDGNSAADDSPYSFEAFIVGPCNALAREAALALARGRQRSLNLLYLSGSSGMGKTHLAHATVAEARRQGPTAPRTPSFDGTRDSARDARPNGGRGASDPARSGARVIHTSAERFTSEFVSAMRNGRNDAWTRRFRGMIDLLVVEDIHFFTGRTQTQLELHHTIGHVLDAGGRVLLTGDRPPRDLESLDERLRVQASGGFVAELDRPDPIVRRHILRAKAAAGGIHLPKDCLDTLVDATGDGSPAGSSVRDVESVLIQVVTTASLLGRPIDLTLTREAIDLKAGSGAVSAPRKLDVSEVVRIVASFFGLPPERLASKSRRRDVLVPRQLAMYLAHRYCEASLVEIGRGLGRDHPSVRNAIGRIERQVLENAPLRYQVEALSEKIDSFLDARGAR